MVVITVKDKKLYVKSDYDGRIVSFMRSRQKRFWNTVTREWEIPESELENFLKAISGYEYTINYADKPEHSEEHKNNLTTTKTPQNLGIVPEWYQYKTKPFNHQVEGVRYGLTHHKFLLADEQGLGKALSLNTKVYTPDGYKLMKDIQVGDYVFNKQGNPVKVLATYDNKNVNMCRITFCDGVSIECCEDHLWEVYIRGTKKVIDTKWFFETGTIGNDRTQCKTKNGYYKYHIDRCQPVKFNEKSVPLDPYVLGCLLGDGGLSTRSIGLTTPDIEICNNISDRLPEGYILNQPPSLQPLGYLITKENTKSGKENKVKTILQQLNLIGTTSHTKFIPNIYKYNSVDVRLNIIRGLIDTDGYTTKDNLLQYSTVSKQLAEDVRFIVESLGFIVTFSEAPCGYSGKITGTAYTLTIRGDDPSVLCNLSRKKDKLKPRKFKPRRQIIKIERIGKGDAKCITVDDIEGLYLIDHFVVTHNTKQMLDLACILKKEKEVKHVLIIACVNGLKYNWQREVSTHTNEKAYILGTRVSKKGNVSIGSNEDRLADIESIGKNKQLDDCYFIITNIETLRYSKKIEVPLKTKKNGVQRFKKQTVFPIVEALQKQIKEGNIGMIIADEVHHCKDSNSQQARALFCLNTPYQAALTGTPIMNSPVDAYTPLHWLGLEEHSFYAFQKHYCIMGGFGQHQVVGYKNLPDLQAALDKCMLRRLKSEVLDLPEKIYINEYVEMSKEQTKLYNEVLSSLVENIDKIKLSPNPLTQLIRLRQVTGNPALLSSTAKTNPKFDRMLELVDDIVQSGNKCIIFSNWTNVIDPAYDLLQSKGYNPMRYTGQNKDTREQEKDEFMKNPKCKVLLGTIGAMGTGLTLTAATTCIFLDEPWNRATKDQAEDRIHRIGTKSSPNIITIMCKGTIDEKINNLVYKKGKMSDVIIDKEEDIMKNPKIVNYLLSID